MIPPSGLLTLTDTHTFVEFCNDDSRDEFWRVMMLSAPSLPGGWYRRGRFSYRRFDFTEIPAHRTSASAGDRCLSMYMIIDISHFCFTHTADAGTMYEENKIPGLHGDILSVWIRAATRATPQSRLPAASLRSQMALPQYIHARPELFEECFCNRDEPHMPPEDTHLSRDYVLKAWADGVISPCRIGCRFWMKCWFAASACTSFHASRMMSWALWLCPHVWATFFTECTSQPCFANDCNRAVMASES